MSAISEYYLQAELSLAAYSNLFTGITGQQYENALKDGGNGMSAAQAADFASKYTVIQQPGRVGKSCPPFILNSCVGRTCPPYK